MPQQALHYFGVVVVLPQQGRVGVAQCVPSLNFDPGFRGDWLDVMLHDPTHPVRLLASHLRAGDGEPVWLLTLQAQGWDSKNENQSDQRK